MTIYTISAFIIFIYFFIFFIAGTFLKNNSIVDIGWGIGFVILNYALMGITKKVDIITLIFSILVSLWGLRLFVHIYSRNHGKPEDFRYAAWRKEWGKWVVVRSFFQVYLLQAIFMWVVSLPIQALYGSTTQLHGLLLVGVMVWIIGFLFESISDRQLKQFISNPTNKGRIIETGLWKYSRHPNYFGEAVIWWGLALVSFSGSCNYLSFIGSAFITFSLLFISGVPLIEKRNENKEGYQEYKMRTSVFIPWFPKK